jgi:hypothetical protein
MRPKLTEDELQTFIMERLTKQAECAAITQVYVRPTGLKPPQKTWGHSLVSRHVNAPRSAKETDAMLKVIAALRSEYDLIPDACGRLYHREIHAMARFIEVPAQGHYGDCECRRDSVVTPSGPAHCNVHFAAGAALHVNTSMQEMFGRMQDAEPISGA